MGELRASDELTEYVAGALGLKNPEVEFEVPVRRGLRLDAVIHTPETTYIVEFKSRTARWDQLSQLSFAMQLYGREPKDFTGNIQGVLVAPAIPKDIQDAAEGVGVIPIIAPLELFDRSRWGQEHVPLTTSKSWAVAVAVLRQRRFPNLRAISKDSGASLAWCQAVIQGLAQRGVVEQRRGHIELLDPKRLFDAVAAERPMKSLEIGQVPTGIKDWEELHALMSQQWSGLMARMERPGIWTCGLTAAMEYTNYMARHDRFQLYTESLDQLKDLFKDQLGGIPLHVYRPDRPMGPTSQVLGDLPTVSLEQALLDVAGMGFQARDTANALVEALRA